MTDQAIASNPLSRPKIHRLPAPMPRHQKIVKNAQAFMRRHMAARPLLFTCSAAAAMVLLAVLLNGFISLVAYHIGTLPKLSAGIANTSDQVLKTTFPDAMASTISHDKAGHTILITDDEGTIVGQMAKLPSEEERLTEINDISEIDKNTGRELLSIVSKY